MLNTDRWLPDYTVRRVLELGFSFRVLLVLQLARRLFAFLFDDQRLCSAPDLVCAFVHSRRRLICICLQTCLPVLVVSCDNNIIKSIFVCAFFPDTRRCRRNYQEIVDKFIGGGFYEQKCEFNLKCMARTTSRSPRDHLNTFICHVIIIIVIKYSIWWMPFMEWFTNHYRAREGVEVSYLVPQPPRRCNT